MNLSRRGAVAGILATAAMPGWRRVMWPMNFEAYQAGIPTSHRYIVP